MKHKPCIYCESKTFREEAICYLCHQNKGLKQLVEANEWLTKELNKKQAALNKCPELIAKQNGSLSRRMHGAQEGLKEIRKLMPKHMDLIRPLHLLRMENIITEALKIE